MPSPMRLLGVLCGVCIHPLFLLTGQGVFLKRPGAQIKGASGVCSRSSRPLSAHTGAYAGERGKGGMFLLMAFREFIFQQEICMMLFFGEFDFTSPRAP